MEFKHFSHDHNLVLCEVSEDKEASHCNGCFQLIRGLAYLCEICSTFCLHKSCAELPRQMLHPLHSAHQLTLLAEPPYDSKNFVCEDCRDLCFGFTFHCNRCHFNLDVKCATFDDQSPLITKVKNGRTKLNHFIHRHVLVLFNCTEQFQAVTCSACQLSISGLAFCCLDCKFYLHTWCIDIPKELDCLFHPQHPLIAENVQFRPYKIRCDACTMDIQGIAFCCHSCSCNFHFLCAKVMMPTLTHKRRHKHDLVYFLATNHDLFWCYACGGYCNASFYRCVRCDINLHLECVPIPKIIKYEGHFHPLTLMDSFKEDDSGECYCDACEKKRNPEHHVYYCEECKYLAHIECVVNESADSGSDHEIYGYIDSNIENTEGDKTEEEYDANEEIEAEEESGEGEESETEEEYDAKEEIGAEEESEEGEESETEESYCDAEDPTSTELLQNKIKIQHFSHDHLLSFYEDYDEFYNFYLPELLYQYFAGKRKPHNMVPKKCSGCQEDIFGAAYGCEICKQYALHKICAELPHEMLHPLHSLHPLTLFVKPPYSLGITVCDGCRDLCTHFTYHCDICLFNLDVKCASSLANDRSLRSKEDRERKTKLSSSTHSHILTQFNCRESVLSGCRVCGQYMWDPAYGCFDCYFIVHESCAATPREIQHPFHPQHPLTIGHTDPVNKEECKACRREIFENVAYCCADCNFNLHVFCVNSLKTTLKHKCHEHKLFYFPASITGHFRCNACRGLCQNASFYRCVACDLNLHLECIPLPRTLIHECHIHPLTLMDSVVEEDSGEYYCDACEKKRDPKHHVYYCKECMYIAHIHCVASEEKNISVLSYLVPRSKVEEDSATSEQVVQPCPLWTLLPDSDSYLRRVEKKVNGKRSQMRRQRKKQLQ